MPPDDSIVPVILPEPVAASADQSPGDGPAGATADAVAHWFDLENDRRTPGAGRELWRRCRGCGAIPAHVAIGKHPPRLPLGGRAVHGMVRRPRPDRTAGVTRDGRRLSRRRGARRTRGQHVASAARGDQVPAPARRLLDADRGRRGVDNLCRHPSGRTAGRSTKTPRSCSTGCSRRSKPSRRHCPGCATGRCCSSALPRRCGRARSRAHARPRDTPRRRHRAVSAVAQERSGRPRHQAVATGGTHGCSVRSPRSMPGSLPRRSPRARCSGGSGGCRRARRRRRTRRKPAADRYRLGTDPIDTDSIALIVKPGRPRRVRRGGVCRPQPAARSDFERRRRRRAHRPAQAVLRPRLAREPRGICRARRIAAQSAEGHPVNIGGRDSGDDKRKPLANDLAARTPDQVAAR